MKTIAPQLNVAPLNSSIFSMHEARCINTINSCATTEGIAALIEGMTRLNSSIFPMSFIHCIDNIERFGLHEGLLVRAMPLQRSND
jgi:hypothetical protein